VRLNSAIRNSSISFKKLEALNNQEVEVIVLPLFDQKLKKWQNPKKSFLNLPAQLNLYFPILQQMSTG
jgi:hypothetical protein